jgi:hypothetical protein
MIKKTALKVMKKAGLIHKKVVVTAKKARIKQNLGNGFERFVFTHTVGPNTVFTETFNAGNLKVISGGWFIQNNLSQVAYATSSYSQSPNRWIITLANPTSNSRQASFTFITKT